MTLKELREGVSSVPPDCHEALMVAAQNVKEEPYMRKKAISTPVLAALILVLLAATAFGAYTLTRSPQTDAVTQARHALLAKYGLTTETLGLFDPVPEQADESWTVTFYPASFYPPLLGEYTVKVAPGMEPEASWTHDDVDPALWQDGSLEAPVWGQAQLLKALQDGEAANAIVIPLWEQAPVERMQTGLVPPDDLAEDEGIWYGQRVKRTTPTADAMAEADAVALAKQAVVEESGLSEAVLDGAETNTTFYTRETDNPIWGVQFYLVDNGIVQDYGVMVDAHTGEILHIGVITGANG